MPEVFINYRTGDGDMTAALIDQALSVRFGEDSSFRASKSIKPGTQFADELLRNVRRSSLFLAVIGPRWAQSPLLHQEDDWVRREILEAYACGIPVVPVIEGRRTDRLNGVELPARLARLADVHSVRLDTQNAPADLVRICDLVSDMVPSLKQTAPGDAPSPDSGSVNNSVDEVNGTAVQSRDIDGDVGTVVKDSSGPVHTGSGNINHTSRHISGGRHFSGDGMTYFEGDNRGGIHQNHAPRRRADDEE